MSISINPIYINDIKNGLEKSLQVIYDDRKGIGRVNECVRVNEPSRIVVDRVMSDKMESTNRSSRMVVCSGNVSNENNSNSAVVVQKRSSESMPKNSMIGGNITNHPSRSTSTVIEQLPTYFYKQPQQTIQKMQPHHQSFTITSPSYVGNNSLPVPQNRPNNQSRVEIRRNSSEKNMKDIQNKNPLTQSYLEPNVSYTPLSTPLEGGKKIRKSGLTVMRSLDNEKNA